MFCAIIILGIILTKLSSIKNERCYYCGKGMEDLDDDAMYLDNGRYKDLLWAHKGCVPKRKTDKNKDKNWMDIQ